MSRVYLASRYIRRVEMCSYAAELEAMGHTVTSRWLRGEHQFSGALAGVAHEYETNGRMHPDAQRFAIADVEDITTADVFITFTEEPGKLGDPRGGRHVEFGLAYAMGKHIIVVGYQENVFHLLPDVRFFPSWEVARTNLGRERHDEVKP